MKKVIYVCAVELRIYFLHIVLLDAGTFSFGVAVFTSKTSLDVHSADRTYDHFVSC